MNTDKILGMSVSDVERVNYEISRLRLFAVYDFFNQRIVFASEDVSKCRAFLRDFALKNIVLSMQQYYIVRFDPYV